jgi:hypothetical protein
VGDSADVLGFDMGLFCIPPGAVPVFWQDRRGVGFVQQVSRVVRFVSTCSGSVCATSGPCFWCGGQAIVCTVFVAIRGFGDLVGGQP